MFSIHEHLKKKRAPIDKWSIKEQLCLASAVVRSGDQNWTSVSRSLKVFQDPNRPSDWFSQKNCAAQYGLLLDNVDTPKRKKRLTDKFGNSPEVPAETESSLELIQKKLTEERITELNMKLQQLRKEYQSVAYETKLIKSGKASVERINQIYNSILERKKIEDKKKAELAVFLREREEKKQEMERQLRPGLKLVTGITSPSMSDSKDETIAEMSKPTTSPLLTSLLKSPSPAPNPSLLHRVSSLAKTNLSTSLLQEQEKESKVQIVAPEPKPIPVPEFKAVTTENAVLPEIIPKPIIETSTLSDDILNINLEAPFGTRDSTKLSKDVFDDLSIDETLAVVDNIIRKEQEEELATQLQKQTSNPPLTDLGDNSNSSEMGTENSESDQLESRVEDIIQSISNDDNLLDPEEETKTSTASIDADIKAESSSSKSSSRENGSPPGSVEVVEVELMEDEEEDSKRVSEDKKNLEMSQMISDLRKECGLDKSIDERDVTCDDNKKVDMHDNVLADAIQIEVEDAKSVKSDVDANTEPEAKIVLEKIENVQTDDEDITKTEDTLSHLDMEDDDSPIEVIKDKHGKIKRDYSRKRVEDKHKLQDDDDFDMLSKKGDIIKYKRLDSDRRSESPWNDDEEAVQQSRTKRQYSVSIDSPNSPASIITDDEKEYRIWKKSIFLVFNRLCTHRNSSLFAKPITNEQAPGYHNLVKRPMDLSTIKKNLDNGTLRTTAEFQRDVMLMFQNAIMYNKIGSTVYNMAKEMQKEGLEQLQLLVQAQTQDYPLRRETRTSEPALKRKRI